MHVIFNGLARHFFRRGKKRSHIHIKAHIGKCRGNHFRAAVMAVLAHLGNKQTRAAAFAFGECGTLSRMGFKLSSAS